MIDRDRKVIQHVYKLRYRGVRNYEVPLYNKIYLNTVTQFYIIFKFFLHSYQWNILYMNKNCWAGDLSSPQDGAFASSQTDARLHCFILIASGHFCFCLVLFLSFFIILIVNKTIRYINSFGVYRMEKMTLNIGKYWIVQKNCTS